MSSLELLHGTPAKPQSPEITDEEAAAMARAVVNLFSRWKISDPEAEILLGGLPPRTWNRWKNGSSVRISRDRRARLAHLMGIHKALRIIFREPERAYGWIKRSNTAFAGKSALDMMLNGELTDIIAVRSYLDAERGAW